MSRTKSKTTMPPDTRDDLTPEETDLADMLSAAMQKSLSAAWARSFATSVQKADRWVRRERNAIAHGKDN